MNIRPSIILGAVAVALLLIGVSFAVAMSRREKPPSPFVPDVERNAMKEIARDRERRIAESEDSNRESPEQTNARLTREDAMIDRMAGDGTRQSVRHGDSRAAQGDGIALPVGGVHVVNGAPAPSPPVAGAGQAQQASDDAIQQADAWSTPYDAGYGAYMPSVYAPFVDGPTAQGQQAADQQALNQPGVVPRIVPAQPQVRATPAGGAATSAPAPGAAATPTNPQSPTAPVVPQQPNPQQPSAPQPNGVR